MGLGEADQLRRAGRTAEAEAACRDLLARDPADAAAVHFLGMLASAAGRHAEAEDLVRRSVALRPGAAEFRANLAVALGRAGRHAEAAEVLRDAVGVSPASAEAWHNLGVALEHAADWPGSEAAYGRAADLDPGLAVAHVGLGTALRKRGQYDGAADAYRWAATLRPDDAAAARGLASTCGEAGDLVGATTAYRSLVALPGSTAADGSDLLFHLYYDPQPTPADLLGESLAWAARHAPAAPAWPCVPADSDDAVWSGRRRLRVGYLSPDLRDHPVGRLVEPVVAGHDRSAVEVFCYSDGRPPGDALTARVRDQAGDGWRETHGLSDAALAERVRHDGIDVLVETAGHFAGNRLPMLARRAAPVQVDAFGWCGTTGVAAVDHRLTDAASDPPGRTDPYHVERLVRLPHCAWVYRPRDRAPDVGPSPLERNGFVTFANLNNPIKTTDAMAGLWADVLRRVPGSRLMLLCRGGAAARTADRFARAGVPAGRLVLIENRPRAAYLDLFNRADVALDPFPFAGDNSTCDALWMGVPVVSLVGNAYHARRGLSHLAHAGLAELAVASPAAYADAAVALARDAGRLRSLRAELRDRVAASPLGQVSTFCTALEQCYRIAYLRTAER